MKNYVKPIVEINMFDTEEILSQSGVIGAASDLSTASKSVITEYNKTASNQIDATATAVEFQW